MNGPKNDSWDVRELKALRKRERAIIDTIRDYKTMDNRTPLAWLKGEIRHYETLLIAIRQQIAAVEALQRTGLRS